MRRTEIEIREMAESCICQILKFADDAEAAAGDQERTLDCVAQIKNEARQMLEELLIKEGHAAEEIVSRERKEYDFFGRLILVVEDNDINMEIAEFFLSDAGFTIEKAWDGKDAIDAFQKNPEFYYDAILMDVEMPDMNGLQATEIIRSMGHSDSATIPIVAMTASVTEEDLKKSMDSGMSTHLTKPIDREKLYDILSTVLSK